MAARGSAAWLRNSTDVDLFSHEADEMRTLVRVLPDAASAAGVTLAIVRDVGALVRATLKWSDGELALDVVHEPVPDIEAPPPPVEGIVVESLSDLRANKLSCILSRSEPRDLVDLTSSIAPATLPSAISSWHSRRTPVSIPACSPGYCLAFLQSLCHRCSSR